MATPKASTSLRVLALEPYYGGSHRAFIDGWMAHSRHDFTLLTLPAHHWKWRMQNASLTFAEDLAVLPQRDWDVLWCSSMVNVAELRGLLPQELSDLPVICYFHENQLFYPRQGSESRDLHYSLHHLNSSAAATSLWFNSRHNRDTLASGLKTLLGRMPDRRRPTARVEALLAKSRIAPPGIEAPVAPVSHTKQHQSLPQPDQPLHLLWAARWEHDKGPERLFDALAKVKRLGIDFRLSVVGQQFGEVPAVFARARQELRSQILNWGYQDKREDYYRILGEADVIVSTAHHEFFGLSVLEAVARGCQPLLPDQLAYPELFEPRYLYGNTQQALERALIQVLDASRIRTCPDVTRYFWPRLAQELDQFLAEDSSRCALTGGSLGIVPTA